MDTRLLETFQAVVACGTFARAAEQLGYTQSTVTVHIKQLEQELGVPLFERIGRRMVLTQKGEEALAQANQVVAEVARLRSLGTEGGELTGTLRVDMAETLLCHGMDRVLTEFRELAPNVSLRLRDRTCQQVAENLHEGTCDLGVTYAFDCFAEEFAIAEIARITTVLVTAAAVPPPPLDRPERLSLPFIIDEPDSVFRQAFEHWLEENGIELAETIELWSSAAIKRLVGAGMGFTLAPRFAMEEDLERGVFREIPSAFSHQQFPILAGYRKTSWLTPAARLFLDLTNTHVPAAVGDCR
ncbi:MAG: LysR family transcriptional regulator [Eggerthellaceae bacterium]|nr:LysR family transcriptional regulator [Eggerthellaceae bacterium]